VMLKETVEKKEPRMRVHTIEVDMNDYTQQQRMIEETVKVFGQLDVLIPNAGMMTLEKIGDLDFDQKKYEETCLFRQFQVNTFSVIQQVHFALPFLRSTNGRVLFVSSGTTKRPMPGYALYSASKAAMNMVAECLALEEPNVTFVSLNPGLTDTEMIHSTMNKRVQIIQQAKLQVPNFVMNNPDEVGKIFALVALHAPKQWTGQYLEWNDPKVRELANLSEPLMK